CYRALCQDGEMVMAGCDTGTPTGGAMAGRSRRRITCAEPLLVIAAVLVCPLAGCVSGLQSGDPKVRLETVEKLNDQALLAKLATEDKDGNIRLAAVARLTNQALLTRLATTDE